MTDEQMETKDWMGLIVRGVGMTKCTKFIVWFMDLVDGCADWKQISI